MIYYAPVRPNRRTSIIDSWKLEIMENCHVYRDARIILPDSVASAGSILRHLSTSSPGLAPSPNVAETVAGVSSPARQKAVANAKRSRQNMCIGRILYHKRRESGKTESAENFLRYPLAPRRCFLIYYAPVRPNRRTSIIDSWKLEIMENCEHQFFLLSVYGRTTDALASAGDEGRGRLRQALGSRQRALIQRFPNGTTRHP